MNPHRLLNKIGSNYSAYCIRSFVGVLTRHLMEPNKYATWSSFWGYGLLTQNDLASLAMCSQQRGSC